MAFKYGKIIYSELVYDRVAENGDSRFYEFLNVSVIRHLSGDCGLFPFDKKANMDAIANGDIVISSFKYRDGTDVRIVTEPDRSYTIIKIAEEN